MGRLCRGVSLVELLIVIGIVSLLASVLLPAVQQSREAARTITCRDNIRQIAIAACLHESSHQRFPPGTVDARIPAWGTSAVLLPYLESRGFTEEEFKSECTRDNIGDVARSLLSEPLPTYTCPSDPLVSSAEKFVDDNLVLALWSYAGVSGTGDESTHVTRLLDGEGMLFTKSRIRAGQVKDGLSKTLLLGERKVVYSPTTYQPAWSYCYCGGHLAHQYQHVRRNLNTPRCLDCFSSLHNGGSHFSFGDTHTVFLTDDIELVVLKEMATRRGSFQ